MNIISCHISSFGKIKDQTFDFNEGINVILEENGWGKTTFANFIKAMLFGMPYVRTQKFTERAHFLPWDESVFGGSLTFSENGKIYTVERTFGKKDKDDTFKLFDEDTGLPSSDFSENLGEEIFRVDRESFEKTVFFPQNSLSTNMTSSMNARLGDISSARNDIDKFETALSSLNEIKKKYTINTKATTGIIPGIKKEISLANESKDKLPILDEAYRKQRELLSERRNSLLSLEQKKKELAEKITKQSLREQKLGEIKAKENALKATENELKELSLFFRNDVPSEDEISGIEKEEREAEGLKKKLEQIKSTNVPDEKRALLNKLFPVGELSDEEMETLRNEEARVRELTAKSSEMGLPSDDVKKLKDLRNFFSKHTPTDEELGQMQKLGNALITYDGKIETLGSQYEKAKEEEIAFENSRHLGKSRLPQLFLILSIILFLSAGMFFMLKYLIFAGACLLVGTVLVILSVIFINKAKKEFLDEKKKRSENTAETLSALTDAKNEKETSVNELKNFLSDYLVTPTPDFQDMINEIRDNANLLKVLSEEEKKHIENSSDILDELSNTTIKLNSHLSSFADIYGLDPTKGDNAHKIIGMLSEDRLLFQRVKKEDREKNSFSTELSVKEREVNTFIKRYISEPSERAIDDISVIRTKRINYEAQKKRLLAEQEELKEIVIPEDEMISVKDLQTEEEEIDKEISDLHHILEQEQQTLDKDSDDYGIEQDIADTLPALTEELLAAESRLSVIEKTEEYLKKAKENFLGRYLNPLKTALKKYLSQIDHEYDERNEKIKLDINLEISIEQAGQSHKRDYLSGGQSDLSNLAVRFALLDVLFTNEKPVLILDDPFVNLDKEKIKSALDLLKEVSKDYQIIYFTCHESRAIDHA